MTVFLRTEMQHNSVNDGVIYMGVLFFSLFMVMFNGFSEMAMTIYKLPVFYKQRDLLFFPPWAYSLPMWILKIPISFMEVAVWVSLTYYVVGFDPDVRRYQQRKRACFCVVHLNCPSLFVDMINYKMFLQAVKAIFTTCTG